MSVKNKVFQVVLLALFAIAIDSRAAQASVTLGSEPSITSLCDAALVRAAFSRVSSHNGPATELLVKQVIFLNSLPLNNAAFLETLKGHPLTVSVAVGDAESIQQYVEFTLQKLLAVKISMNNYVAQLTDDVPDADGFESLAKKAFFRYAHKARKLQLALFRQRHLFRTGQDLTKEEFDLIEDAHNLELENKPKGADGISSNQLANYNFSYLRAKRTLLLTKFSAEETDEILNTGIAGGFINGLKKLLNAFGTRFEIVGDEAQIAANAKMTPEVKNNRDGDAFRKGIGERKSADAQYALAVAEADSFVELAEGVLNDEKKKLAEAESTLQLVGPRIEAKTATPSEVALFSKTMVLIDSLEVSIADKEESVKSAKAASTERLNELNAYRLETQQLEQEGNTAAQDAKFGAIQQRIERSRSNQFNPNGAGAGTREAIDSMKQTAAMGRSMRKIAASSPQAQEAEMKLTEAKVREESATARGLARLKAKQAPVAAAPAPAVPVEASPAPAPEQAPQ